MQCISLHEISGFCIFFKGEQTLAAEMFESRYEVSAFVYRMAAMARASKLELPELGYESMSHFIIDIDDLADTLRNISFCCGMSLTWLYTHFK